MSEFYASSSLIFILNIKFSLVHWFYSSTILSQSLCLLCLEENKPNLERLFGVLGLRHKYCVTSMEQKARVVTNALVS